ncbi:hypothetical protein R6Q57_006377 [Mikania cordata]
MKVLGFKSLPQRKKGLRRSGGFPSSISSWVVVVAHGRSRLLKPVQKAAIKKMDMRASKEFLAELRVLTRVHHLNLVCLLGYCVKGSHFLVYEYVENGNLSQHLHESGPSGIHCHGLSESKFLDSARGLEYIH